LNVFPNKVNSKNSFKKKRHDMTRHFHATFMKKTFGKYKHKNQWKNDKRAGRPKLEPQKIAQNIAKSTNFQGLI